jgi:hypothetical protein
MTPHDEKTATAKREAQRNAEHVALVKSGKAVDLIAAMARCFHSGNHGTEKIRRF